MDTLRSRLIVWGLIGVTSICLSEATNTAREPIQFEIEPVRNETTQEKCFKESIDRLQKASRGMDIADEQYVDRLLNLIRYDQFMFEFFHPWGLYLDEQVERYSDIKCFRRLYGLLYVRKRRLTRFDQPSSKYVGIKVDIEYPKLCVECVDLADFYFDIDASERAETNRAARFINVCARYVRGELNLLRPKGPYEAPKLLSHDIDVNSVKFELDYAGSTREVNVKAKRVWERLNILLPWINRAVATSLTCENCTAKYLANIKRVFRLAGTCLLGDCSALEVMPDFELIDKIAIALKHRLKTGDPKFLNHLIRVNSSEHEMVLRRIEGLSNVQIMGYHKVEVSVRWLYRLDVFLRYPEIYVTADLQPLGDPENVVPMFTCKKNFLTYFSIYAVFRFGDFEYAQFTLSNPENIQFDVPPFRLLTGNVGMIPLTAQSELSDPTLMAKCHFVHYIYEDLFIVVRSVLHLHRCNRGQCVDSDWIARTPISESSDYHPSELLELFDHTVSLATDV